MTVKKVAKKAVKKASVKRGTFNVQELFGLSENDLKIADYVSNAFIGVPKKNAMRILCATIFIAIRNL